MLTNSFAGRPFPYYFLLDFMSFWLCNYCIANDFINTRGCGNAVLLFTDNVVGERIFRIGSSRYKMDPSRRTLQRISGGPFI